MLYQATSVSCCLVPDTEVEAHTLTRLKQVVSDSKRKRDTVWCANDPIALNVWYQTQQNVSEV